MVAMPEVVICVAFGCQSEMRRRHLTLDHQSEPPLKGKPVASAKVVKGTTYGLDFGG